MYFITNTFISYFGFEYLDKFVQRLGYDKKNSQLIYGIVHSLFLGNLSVSYLLGLCNYNIWFKLCGISLGYTFYDFRHYINNKFSDMFVHHLLMSYGFIYLFLMNHKFIPFIPNFATLLSQVYLCEFSNIPLAISFFLYYQKKTHIKFFRTNSIALIISYFLLRVVNFTHMTYKLNILKVNTFYYFSMLLTSLNYYWFYKIFKKAIIIEKKNI